MNEEEEILKGIAELQKKKMKESIYTYETKFPVVALNWSCRRDETFRLAFSSTFAAPYAFVQILQFDPYQRIRPTSTNYFSHPAYTPNALAFLPDPGCLYSDLLATVTDTLRLWHLHGDSVKLRCQLGDYPTTNLRMLDWNRTQLRRIATLSSDNTCTVWDIDAGTAEVQLFTNRDGPVLAVRDVAWGAADVLAATFDDGTVKCVDLREGRRPRTIHTVTGGCAGLVEWNYRDPKFLAVTQGVSGVVVVDERRPEAVAVMRRHTATVNTMAWDPQSPSRICTAGNDARPLVWEITAPGNTQVVAQYAAYGMVEQLKWSSLHPELVAFGSANSVQVERVE